MSHIDSYDHEYVGHLGYLPIYHPLQEIERGRWGDYDFGADPTNLILGGGSGEHPGLVLHKLECFVTKFLLDQISDEEEAALSEDDKEYIINLAFINYAEIFEFCEWRIDDISSFHKMAKSDAMRSPVAKDETVEEWLMKSIGELVYYSLPELNPEHDRLQKIFADFTIFPIMRNVSI
ncbi:MAG TPA: hypothetical protein VIN11_06945, partial [Roseivirga sp.]